MILKHLLKSLLKKLPFDFTRNQKYDSQTKKVLARCLRPDSNCIDIGCHKGEVLSEILRIAPQGNHVGFEPIPYLYERLKSTFPATCTFYRIALSNSKGHTTFRHVISNPSFSGIKERKYTNHKEQVEIIDVPMDTLDNLLPDQDIDFIKIDVEGGEMLVLEGAVNTIKRCKPIIIFEHGLGAADYYGAKPEDLYDLLHDQCGMQVSLMKYWLKGNPPLSRSAFCNLFYTNREYYFIAYP